MRVRSGGVLNAQEKESVVQTSRNGRRHVLPEERGHPNGKINERWVGMWPLYWIGMFGTFSQAVRETRLSARTSPACLHT